MEELPYSYRSRWAVDEALREGTVMYVYHSMTKKDFSLHAAKRFFSRGWTKSKRKYSISGPWQDLTIPYNNMREMQTAAEGCKQLTLYEEEPILEVEGVEVDLGPIVICKAFRTYKAFTVQDISSSFGATITAAFVACKYSEYFGSRVRIASWNLAISKDSANSEYIVSDIVKAYSMDPVYPMPSKETCLRCPYSVDCNWSWL